MNFLEERILNDGVIRQGNILQIDNFLNHQIDVGVLRQIADEFKQRFCDVEINKVLTIESTMLGYVCNVPVVFAKKGTTANSGRRSGCACTC